MGTQIAPLEYTVFRVDRGKMQVVEKNKTVWPKNFTMDIRQSF